jgi:1,4-alpha-glucan branching enzyme
MSGTRDDKFSNIRAFITYMFAHPGKKLLFMGTESGQLIEWDYDVPIFWNLLKDERHSKLQHFFRSLNKFYLENRPLYERDSSWKGFDWIHHDDYTNSVIAFKRTDDDENEIIAVCNFRPILHENYFIGVSKNGTYAEIFNSDSVDFGGSGITNGDHIVPREMKIHGCNQGIPLVLPPMSVIYLKCVDNS